MRDSGIVYLAWNTATDKCYVGQTMRTLVVREREHWCASKDSDFRFYVDFREHGRDAVVWYVLEAGIEELELNEREKHWIRVFDTFHNGYNRNAGGWSANREERAVIISDPDYQARMSLIALERWQDDGYRANREAAHREAMQDADLREHLSGVTEELWQDAEYRAQMEAARAEPAYRQNISDKAKERYRDPAYRERVALASKQGRADSRFKRAQEAGQSFLLDMPVPCEESDDVSL